MSTLILLARNESHMGIFKCKESRVYLSGIVV